MKRKRILHVEGNEDGTVGGTHKVLADLITRMPARFQPVVLFYQDNPWVDRLRHEGIEVHTWDAERTEEKRRLTSGGLLGTLRGLGSSIHRRAAFIRERRIDLVVLNNSHRQHVDEWIPATRLARIPCTTYASGNPAREPSLLRRILMKQLDQVFAVSRLMKEGVLASDYPLSKITLTYPGLDFHGIDSRRYRPSAEVRQEFSVADGQLLAIMTGNLRSWKGQHIVVEAVGKLSPLHREALRLVFVGDVHGNEDYTDSIKSRVRQLELDDVVTFAGWRNDVPDILEAADIAIHSSVVPEPFGLVVLEAMAHGCATVAADRGGPVEMIELGVSGLTFDTDRPETLSECLALLITDAAKRESLASGARTRARQFDQDRHVNLVAAALDRLL